MSHSTGEGPAVPPRRPLPGGVPPQAGARPSRRARSPPETLRGPQNATPLTASRRTAPKISTEKESLPPRPHQSSGTPPRGTDPEKEINIIDYRCSDIDHPVGGWKYRCTSPLSPHPVELGDFLKAHRTEITPAQVGLPTSGTRRTPGLRREEVALLAGVGVSWYTWIEQGRAANVSGEVLDASPAPPTRPDAAALPPAPRRRRRRPRTGGVTPGPERRSNRSSTTGCRTRPTWPAATGTWSPSTRRPAT